MRSALQKHAFRSTNRCRSAWGLTITARIFPLKQHGDSVAWKGKRVVVGTSNLTGNYWDGAVSVVNVESGKIIEEELDSGASSLAALEKVIAVGCDNAEIKLLEFDESTEQIEEVEVYKGHFDCVSALRSRSDANSSNQLLSASWDTTYVRARARCVCA
jgi:hypothetical protein